MGMRRAIAAILALSIVILAPGPGAYEAAATIIRVPLKIATPGATGVVNANNRAVSLNNLSLPAGYLDIGLSHNAVLSSFITPEGTVSAAAESAEVSQVLAVSAQASAAMHGPAAAPASRGENKGLNPFASRKKEKAALSPTARLKGIGQDAVKLNVSAGDLSSAELKAKADFTVQGRDSGAVAAAPAVKGTFGALKNRLFGKNADRDNSDFTPKSSKEPQAPKSEEHLVYDIHDGYFRAGYLAATVWRAGTSLELPKVSKSFGRTKDGERVQFIKGLGYRIAELTKSEAAGQAFIARALKAKESEVASLIDASLSEVKTESGALLENLQDADYVQGYLTGLAWRPGKQLVMPAPSFADRFKFGLRKKMKARDERFMKGLYASLDGRAGSPVELIKEKLADGPAVGMRDFGVKLGYVLTEVLTPLHDAAIEQGLPYIPGKIIIPRSIKGLVLGHSIFIIFGIYMHISAQPYLVYGLTGSKTMMGVIRNVHFGAYSASSFLPIGPTIDKTDYRSMFVWTSVSRALLMGLIPVLFFSGYMTFAVLIAIVALNPMFQSLMTNSDAAARDSMLGRDENVVREGTAFLTKVSAIGGLVIPAAAAWVVSQLVVAFGSPGGYAAAYAGYALMLILSIPVFLLMVRDPRYYDPSVKQKPSTNPLNIFVPFWIVIRAPFRAARWLWGKAAKRLGRNRGEAVASKDVEAVLAEAKSREIPFVEGKPFKNFRERAARFFDKIEATQGVSVILRSDTLSILVAVTAIELFIADALMFVLIPNYIIDVIRPVAELASVPVIGSMLTTPVGIMGLMLTAGAIGRYMGSRWASGAKGARRIKKWGHKTLYRAAAVSGLTFWAMLIPTFFVAPAGAAGAAVMSIPLFAGAMAVLLAFEFAMSLLATPLGIAMSPVRRKQIPNDMVGKVSAAFTMVDVGLMAAGALLIGILIDLVPIQIAVAVIAVLITMTSILEWFAPNWLKKINPEGWEHGES
jgi:hypothetical protein